jgi:5'-nucleotidase (lipoprotein e(P4) family)
MRIMTLVIALGVGGCATAPASPTPAAPGPAEAPSAENAAERHREVHWVRAAAEYRALAVQVYRSAGDRLREIADTLSVDDWAVIMDADETLLDNSEFERRIAETGQPFEESLWSEWVREEAAGAVPGAVDFVALVRRLGGRVAVVTNRDEELCPATRRNLEALGIRSAVVLCEVDTGEKEGRFRMVRDGTAATGLPPLRVVMWVGDNVGDFPGQDQSLRDAPASALEPFGRTYFVMPNPMYGSWLGNPWR